MVNGECGARCGDVAYVEKPVPREVIKEMIARFV
jgi:hypothetical protein